MADEATHVRKSKTLFLRNLPFTTTNEKLEEIFGDIGPLKTCFVVKPKGAQKCRGFGYVAYSMLEDAEKAKDTIKAVDGRKIFISYAESKKDNRKRKGINHKVPSKEEYGDDGDQEKEDERNEEEEKEYNKAKTDTKDKDALNYLQAKTLVVMGWKDGTSVEDIKKYMAKINVKNIAKLEYPMRDRDYPTALVRFKSIRDTKAGQRKLESNNVKGEALCIMRQKEVKRIKSVSQKTLKQSRLIVRNLSFKCTEDTLRKYFEKFGEITETKIPLKPDGKMYGFGFVQFTSVQDANKAVNGMNMKPIIGRPVAVDWTVPKDKFVEAQTSKSHSVTSSQPSKHQGAKANEKSPRDEGSYSATSEEEKGDEDSDEKESSDSEESEESSGDEKEDSELESQSEDEGFDDKNDSDESDDEENSDRDESGSDTEDFNKDKGKKGKGKKESSKKSDVEEGRTLFIRNVAFETDEEGLEEYFEEFGKINYIRVVMDPNTEHSKGLAFVQFKTVEAAESCLEKANDESRDGGITVDGRKLLVTKAVSRDKASEFKKEKTKKVEDRRNLHLAREGLIRPGTQAAAGLSKEDLAKRMKVEEIKRQKLKNPNIFISTTRLCVRNLPVSLTDKELRQIFLRIAGDKKAIITECRIMRDLERVNGQGVAKSRGYGFVNFTEHKHALQALREANVKPDLFKEKRRLIVEFSLENKEALLAKEKKLERQKTRLSALQQKNQSAEDKKEDKVKKKKEKKKNKQKEKLTDKFIGNVQPEEGSETKKLPKGLPSHWGPKVRHKPRPAQVEAEKKQKKKIKKKRQQRLLGETVEVPTQSIGKRQLSFSDIQSPPSKKRKRQRKEKVDDFDRLVNKYKQKFSSAKNSGKSSKWFEG